MNWPNRRRNIWWVILVGLLTFLLYLRGDFLGQSPTIIDAIIFLVWIALLLAPLFQEVSLFGLTLKKEIEGLKTEVREQLLSIKTIVQSFVHVQIDPVFVNAPSLKITSEKDNIEEEASE